jgi:hypothetical protein
MLKRLLITIIQILALTVSVQLFAQSYSLEPLVDEASKHIAPARVQQAMREFEKKKFSDCVMQLQLSKSDQLQYFSSISISIGSSAENYFLVFPSKYCDAFFGAHAHAYWILCQDKLGHFKLLYSGRSDGLEILKTRSNGLKDLLSAYGFTFIILKYDGQSYKKVSEGEFPHDK